MAGTDFAQQFSTFGNNLNQLGTQQGNSFNFGGQDPTQLFGNYGGNINTDPNQLFSPNAFTGFQPGGKFSGGIINTNGISGNVPDAGGFNFGDFFSKAFGTTKNPGVVPSLLNTAGGAANTFLALKQFGLIKDSLKNQKDQFNRQFDVQKQLTNAQIADRANARHNVNPTQNPTVEEVLAERGIK